MVRTLLIFVSSFYLVISCAQSSFNRDTELDLLFDKSNNSYISIKVDNADRFYLICKEIKLEASSVLKYNGLTIGKVKNKEIRFPISTRQLLRKKDEVLFKKGIYVDVKYKVQKGDTYYKLAKTFGNEDIETFKKRNKLSDDNLPINSIVTLGWLYIENESKPHNALKDKKEVALPVSQKENKNHVKNTELQNSVFTITDSPKQKTKTPDATSSKKDKIILNEKLVSSTKSLSETKDSIYKDERPMENKFDWTNSKGIAYWQPSHRKSMGKYVLHSSAPINSIVKLYNPMLKRSVDAKVIGRIPKDTYRKDIDIVVSPAIAESLGALDSRFMVELTYKN